MVSFLFFKKKENAVSALGKVALYQLQNDAGTREQLLKTFLARLPLKNDTEEAQTLHKLVF